jgi:peptide/nickel transport system substrate-binding protein
VYFSSDEGNLDTYKHFHADLQMHGPTMGRPDRGLFMKQFLSSQVASKENKWHGLNTTRWQSLICRRSWMPAAATCR